MAEIPQEVLDLCDGLDGFPVLLITENCCDVDWYGLELRFKKVGPITHLLDMQGTWSDDLIEVPRAVEHLRQVARTSCM